MTALDLCSPSGLMALLRIIGGAMHKVGSAMFWARLMLTGSSEEKSAALQAAFLAGMNELASGCKAEMEAKSAVLGRRFYEDEDDNPAIYVMWYAVGQFVLSPEEHAQIAAAKRRVRAAWLVLWRTCFPCWRALYSARLRARFAGWRRFASCLRLLSGLSQKCDKRPVWALPGNCVLFVTIS